MSLNPRLSKEWDTVLNGELSARVKPFSHKKYWWCCGKGHRWEAPVSGRTQGRNCPFCSGNKLNREKSLQFTNSDLSLEWDFEKNKNTPSEVHANSSKKAWWVCSKKHSWEAVISSRNNGRGCPFCANRKVSGFNSLEQLRPDIAKEWSVKNTPRATSVSIGSETVVLWECSRCFFEWEAPVYRRSQGGGCPACSGRVATTIDNLELKRPLLCKEWDYGSNNILPSEVKEGSGKMVSWVCSEGHTWRASIYHRARLGRGCPYCTNQRVGYGNDLQTCFPELSEEWDHTRNIISPSDVCPGSGVKVWWLCKEGHSWEADPNHRARSIGGTGCPLCSGGNISKISQEWLDSLGVEDREVRLKIKTKAFTVDGFDPKTNTIYEFLGDFWHGNPDVYDHSKVNQISKKSFGELYDRTFRRFAKLEEAGYSIVFIWEKEFKEM